MSTTLKTPTSTHPLHRLVNRTALLTEIQRLTAFLDTAEDSDQWEEFLAQKQMAVTIEMQRLTNRIALPNSVKSFLETLCKPTDHMSECELRIHQHGIASVARALLQRAA